MNFLIEESEEDGLGPLLPNILITGTPGSGKTTCSQEASRILDGFTHFNVGDFVKENACHEGRDEAFDTFILDEDKLLDGMEPVLSKGGVIVDFHSPEIFPERWFDLVLVLRVNTQILYDRLNKRGYNSKKIDENMSCEIMNVVSEEAHESYDDAIVHELDFNSLEDMDGAMDRIKTWFDSWKVDNSNEGENQS